MAAADHDRAGQAEVAVPYMTVQARDLDRVLIEFQRHEEIPDRFFHRLDLEGAVIKLHLTHRSPGRAILDLPLQVQCRL